MKQPQTRGTVLREAAALPRLPERDSQPEGSLVAAFVANQAPGSSVFDAQSNRR
jgi:hypothetical protein